MKAITINSMSVFNDWISLTTLHFLLGKYPPSPISDSAAPGAATFQGHQKPVYPILVVRASLCSSDSDSDSEGFEDDSELEEIIVTGSNDTTAKTWSRDSQYSLQVNQHWHNEI